jgi:hypothetical protein
MDDVQSLRGQLLSDGRPGARIGGGLCPPRLVARPVRRLVCSELVQIPPGEQSRVMSVIEDNFNGILSDRLDGPDADFFLTQYQDFLSRTVSFDFRGGRVHTQVLERQLESAAVGKTDFQQTRFAADFDFGSDGVTHLCTSIVPGL